MEKTDTAHIEIMSSLASIKTELVGVNEHLVTLNSKVATQEGKIGAMQLRDAFNDGQMKGASKTVNVIWTVVSALLLAGGFEFIKTMFK